jgi:SPP1 gp7 family putative phage head morphogenesis protein
MEGLEPVEWGNQPMALTFQQTNSDKKQQSEEKPKQENKPLKEKPKNEEPDKQKKEVSKMVNAGDDMIEEAEDYESFLKRRFNQWEKEIFSFLNETVGDEIKIKDIELYMEKSFGEFIRQLVHSVNTIGFKNALIAVIKSTYKQGINDAEKELKIDIGFSPSMMTDVNTMADRQLEGFYIDGKRWNGIKGVADDVQKDVSQLVRDAMVNRTGMTQLRKDIQEKLDITKNRAEMIARTETTRFTSMSKIKSYKDSGVVKYKKWDAAEQDRTCPNCLALNGQEVELDDYFELDGVKVFSAPFHPMCRCTTTAVLK